MKSRTSVAIAALTLLLLAASQGSAQAQYNPSIVAGPPNAMGEIAASGMISWPSGAVPINSADVRFYFEALPGMWVQWGPTQTIAVTGGATTGFFGTYSDPVGGPTWAYAEFEFFGTDGLPKLISNSNTVYVP